MHKIIEKQSDKLLTAWRDLRHHLEISITPFDDVINFFSKFHKVKVYTDPYDQTTWPTAWELIEENQYCPFNTILGICYTLQLWERFENITPTVTISIDTRCSSVYYLLYLEQKVYGYEDNIWVNQVELPDTLHHIKSYRMPCLH